MTPAMLVERAISVTRRAHKEKQAIHPDWGMVLVEAVEQLRTRIPPTAPEDFRAGLLERLKDKSYAAEYLRASLDEGPDMFQMAVRDVQYAQGWKR
jgi:hypothetical protein